MRFRDVDAPNTYWRPQNENPIPWVWNVIPGGAAFWRFVSCRPLDGHARTDATFLLPGVRVFTRDGRALPYQFWPRWKQGVVLTRLPPLLLFAAGVSYLYWVRNWALPLVAASAVVTVWVVTDRIRFALALVVIAFAVWVRGNYAN